MTTTYLTDDGVGTLDDQLRELADGNQTALWFLAAAEAFCDGAGVDGQRLTDQVMRALGGIPAVRMRAWEDLCCAVDMWHRWDRVADSQGRHDYLDIPSREQVCLDVVETLREIVARAKVA